ncbi:MAG: hypothetical protein P1U74_00855 [Legionellaceae bacterium]|nr:hypothetical protein [Legionellaceae bacterium]
MQKKFNQRYEVMHSSDEDLQTWQLSNDDNQKEFLKQLFEGITSDDLRANISLNQLDFLTGIGTTRLMSMLPTSNMKNLYKQYLNNLKYIKTREYEINLAKLKNKLSESEDSSLNELNESIKLLLNYIDKNKDTIINNAYSATKLNEIIFSLCELMSPENIDSTATTEYYIRQTAFSGYSTQYFSTERYVNYYNNIDNVSGGRVDRHLIQKLPGPILFVACAAILLSIISSGPIASILYGVAAATMLSFLLVSVVAYFMGYNRTGLSKQLEKVAGPALKVEENRLEKAFEKNMSN